jgi:hypothetical protein
MVTGLVVFVFFDCNSRKKARDIFKEFAVVKLWVDHCVFGDHVELVIFETEFFSDLFPKIPQSLEIVKVDLCLHHIFLVHPRANRDFL